MQEDLIRTRGMGKRWEQEEKSAVRNWFSVCASRRIETTRTEVKSDASAYSDDVSEARTENLRIVTRYHSLL